MDMHFDTINWLAVLVCLIVGQGVLTVWFVALFGTPWAEEYGVADKKQHTKEIPGYTYAIQAVSTALMILGMATLQASLGIDTAGGGIILGLWVAISFSIATALPGYAFLKRWRAFALAMGSQAVLMVIVSAILAVWK